MVPLSARIDPLLLVAEAGHGNSLTCFAAQATALWRENIPPARRHNRSHRRELIYVLARSNCLDPLQMLSVVRELLKQERLLERRAA